MKCLQMADNSYTASLDMHGSVRVRGDVGEGRERGKSGGDQS
jgi:hypothetical protein